MQHVNIALVHYVSSRRWGDEDDMLLSISASLLVSLYEAMDSTSASKSFTVDFIKEILHLPCLTDDPETSLDLFGVVCELLQGEAFLQGTVETKQLHLIWHLLERLDNAVHTELEEDDEKQCKFHLLWLSCLPPLATLYLRTDATTHQVASRISVQTC